MPSDASQSSEIRIYQSGGFTTFYVVQSVATGKTLYTSPSLFGAVLTKVWCFLHGYGWPSAAEMNG